MLCAKKVIAYTSFSFFLSLLLFLSFPALRAEAAGCRGGNEHDFGTYGQCTVCGIGAAAECGGHYYETLTEALDGACPGDTVTLFFDPAPDARYEIGEGITLSCKGAQIYAAVSNRGRIEGGLFYGKVENHGVIADAGILDKLLCHPESEVLGCHLEGTAKLCGGYLFGGSIGRLTIYLSHDAAVHAPTTDLWSTDLSEAGLTLINQSALDLAELAPLPEGYAFFRSDEARCADGLKIGEAAILVRHTHTMGNELSYHAEEHFSLCTACGYRAPDTVGRHLLAYTDLENGAHSASCELCGYTTSLLHEGGTASCTAPAICIICRAPYGEADPEAHSPSEDGTCARCGFVYPARCDTTLYKTPIEALAAARVGDTVTLLCDIAEDALCIPLGVTLNAGGHALSGELINYGTLIGGRCYGRVRNIGSLEGACLYGGLENEGLVRSATLSSAVENRESGSILNLAEGDITLGEGFSILRGGIVDCRHHIGGTADCTTWAICALCGVGYGEPIPHSFLIYYDDGNATCTEDGTATAVCAHCNARDTVVRVGSRRAHEDTDRDGHCDGCRLSLAPPVIVTTSAPTTTAPPITTTKPSTTQVPSTQPQVSTPVTAAPPEPAVTTSTPQAAKPSDEPFPWHYALIGLALGGIAVLWIGKRED